MKQKLNSQIHLHYTPASHVTLGNSLNPSDPRFLYCFKNPYLRKLHERDLAKALTTAPDL